MKPESAYYESLHETPLIANTIARKKLYEMNKVRACVRARVRACVRACARASLCAFVLSVGA